MPVHFTELPLADEIVDRIHEEQRIPVGPAMEFS